MTAPELAPGYFLDFPEPTGPFGPNPLVGASVDLAAIADTNPFDGNVSASSGDLWASSVDPNATYSPLSLAPGQTGTITLTFAPRGHKGQVVRGFVDVDTWDPFALGGDEVTSIPYSYRVG